LEEIIQLAHFHATVIRSRKHTFFVIQSGRYSIIDVKWNANEDENMDTLQLASFESEGEG
jgi:hypothetical protein